MARAPKTFRARFALPEGTEHYVDPVDDEEMDGEEPMTEEDLCSIVNGQINDAKTYESSDLVELRQKALQYFDGDIDITAAPGRSSVVSRDVSDTHGLIMPGLMRVFLATDNIAIYNPVLPSDEQFARQVTDYVNHVVMKECGGYIQFRSAFHNGLLMGNGPIKHWWDDTPEYSTESFSGLEEIAYIKLVMDPEVEVIECSGYDDPDWSPPPPPMMPDMGPGMDMPPGMPAAPAPNMDPGVPEGMPVPAAPKLYDCKIKRCTSKGRLRVVALAPEDLLLGREVISLDEEHVRFAAHRWIKTRSALIKEGYDPDQVDELPAYTGATMDSPEQRERDRRRLFGGGDNAPDRATELIEGYECYMQCDFDGDGVAEWRKIVVAGTGGKRELLANEEWGDDLPFSDIVPDPVPHRWRGRSLFDLVEDIQRIKTVLTRQTLDNIYMSNTPRQYVLENGVVNPEALQDYEIGSTIIERTANSVRFDDIPFVADKTFPILEYMDQTIEKRTGVSRSTVALDLDALQDQTATAVNAQQASAHTKVEEYARNIAEHGGLKRVFSKILKLVVKHQDRARTVRLRDGWVTVDPRAWNANMDVTINTGLGSGSRERDLTMLMGIAQKQEAIIMQMGPTNPVLGIDKLFDTYRLMTEAAGLKPADRFFPEIPPETMQQMAEMASKKVDPKVQAAQMQMQADAQSAQFKAQTDLQSKQIDAQLDAAKMKFQSQFDEKALQMKAQHDRQTMETKAIADAHMARFQQNIELAAAQRDAELQQVQLERQAQVEERQAQADIAVKQADAQWKAQLEQMNFERESALAQQKFEFDKKLKLLDLYVKSQIAASKSAEGGGGEGEAAPETNYDELLGRLADLGDQLAQGQAHHSETTTALLAEMARPKRNRVIRENGQVVGSEQE